MKPITTLKRTAFALALLGAATVASSGAHAAPTHYWPGDPTMISTMTAGCMLSYRGENFTPGGWVRVDIGTEHQPGQPFTSYTIFTHAANDGTVTGMFWTYMLGVGTIYVQGENPNSISSNQSFDANCYDYHGSWG